MMPYVDQIPRLLLMDPSVVQYDSHSKTSNMVLFDGLSLAEFIKSHKAEVKNPEFPS